MQIHSALRARQELEHALDALGVGVDLLGLQSSLSALVTALGHDAVGTNCSGTAVERAQQSDTLRVVPGADFEPQFDQPYTHGGIDRREGDGEVTIDDARGGAVPHHVPVRIGLIDGEAYWGVLRGCALKGQQNADEEGQGQRCEPDCAFSGSDGWLHLLPFRACRATFVTVGLLPWCCLPLLCSSYEATPPSCSC